jgi:hypothetical protein
MERAADQSEQVLHQPVPEPALRSCLKIVIHFGAGGLKGALNRRRSAEGSWLKKRTRPIVAAIYRPMLTRVRPHLMKSLLRRIRAV